jgi:hypothetical protein
MAETIQDNLGARLRRLPGQLLLSLVNATALLIIVAAILALIVFSRFEGFAGGVATTITDAVLARADVSADQARANLQAIAGEIRGMAAAIRDAKASAVQLNPKIETLSGQLTALQATIDRLIDSQALLTDAAIEKIGAEVTDGLMRLRACAPGAASG